MTCIAGLVEGGRVWIGGDSCASNADTWHDVGPVKVFHLGELLVGVAGSVRVADLVRYHVPGLRANDEPPDRFLRSTFAAALWTVLREADQLREGEFEGELLVGFAGRLVMVQSDLSILDSAEGGAAIGSGAFAPWSGPNGAPPGAVCGVWEPNPAMPPWSALP